jgi:Cof subfamily protein (haloacid dehalogenase superfamily)
MGTPHATVTATGEIRLVALDIDGTLLRTDKQLTRRTGQAIGAAAAAGVRVVLASARPPRSVRGIHEALGLDTVQINYNGALIHDPVNARHLFHQPLDAAVARRVIAAARRVDRRCMVSIEILDRWYTDHFDESLPTETSLQFKPDFIGPLSAFLTVPVTKLMLLAPPERMARIRTAVERRFIPAVGLAVSDAHLLQICHRDTSKADALAHVAEHYGVRRQQVLAIGDAPNDVAMLRWAGLGVAVENAWPAARAAADRIVPENDADGVAHAIEQYVLPAPSD